MLEVKTFIASSFPPQTDRSQSMSADCKITDHSLLFYLDKSAVLYGFSCSAFILDLIASIESFFLSPNADRIVSSSASNKKNPLKRLRKPLTNQLLLRDIHLHCWAGDQNLGTL